MSRILYNDPWQSANRETSESHSANLPESRVHIQNPHPFALQGPPILSNQPPILIREVPLRVIRDQQHQEQVIGSQIINADSSKISAPQPTAFVSRNPSFITEQNQKPFHQFQAPHYFPTVRPGHNSHSPPGLAEDLRQQTQPNTNFQQPKQYQLNGPHKTPRMYNSMSPPYMPPESIHTRTQPQCFQHPEFRSRRADESMLDPHMERCESRRWQNKYEDLKEKYDKLLPQVHNNSVLEDNWMLEEENRLLREKIKVLESRDESYYLEMKIKIEQMIEYHREATNKECELLIDRFRLQSKVDQAEN